MFLKIIEIKKLLLAVLLGTALLGHADAAEILNPTTANMVLGSSGSMESDFIYSFCPTASPNCLPSPVTMTGARVTLVVTSQITNVTMQLNVLGPGASSGIACTGPTVVQTTALDFSCLLPTPLTETRGLFPQSAYIFTPHFTYTGRATPQNGQMRFFLETATPTSTVPEPTSIVLVGVVLAGLVGRRRFSVPV